MNTCPNCGKPLRPDDRFCTGCGAVVEQNTQAPENNRVCSNCGNPLKINDLFCTACGTVAGQAAATQNQEPTQEAEQCGNCGYIMPKGAMFCDRCGNPMHQTMATYPAVAPVKQGKTEKKKSSLPLILTWCILGTVIVALIAFIVILFVSPETFGMGGANNSDEVVEKLYETEEVTTATPETETKEPETTEEVIETKAPKEPEKESVTETEETTEKKVSFEDDPLVYFIENADKRYFALSEIESFTATECRLARNGIYARHGRMFNDSGLQQYFMSFDWYRPTISPDRFTEALLNEYELANRNLIIEYENARGFN